MTNQRDMTQAQFEAALTKHGISLDVGPLGHRDVGGGYHVCGLNGGSSRRAQLAYLLKAQDERRRREERIEKLCAERDALLGEKRDGERIGICDGETFKLVLDKLTAEECAAVVLALRAARGAP